MAKKMKTSALIKAEKSAYTYKKHIITDNIGNEWEISVDENMNPAKLMYMVNLMLRFTFAAAKDELLKDFDNEQCEGYFGTMLSISLLMTYTDLQFDLTEAQIEDFEKEVQGYIDIMNCFLNLEIYQQIYKLFNKERYDKTLSEFQTLFEQEYKKIVKENEDLISTEEVVEDEPVITQA